MPRTITSRFTSERATVIEQFATTIVPTESVTCRVNPKTPDAVGMPDTMPVAPSKVTPGGKEPAVIAQV
jgi:hypothetical protein